MPPVIVTVIDGVTYHQNIVERGNCPRCCFCNEEEGKLRCAVFNDDRYDCGNGAFEKVGQNASKDDVDIPDTP